jgi:hypothetical protein
VRRPRPPQRPGDLGRCLTISNRQFPTFAESNYWAHGFSPQFFFLVDESLLFFSKVFKHIWDVHPGIPGATWGSANEQKDMDNSVDFLEGLDCLPSGKRLHSQLWKITIF